MDDVYDAAYKYLLSTMGVPEDTTIELGIENENSFCRDFYYNLLWSDDKTDEQVEKEILDAVAELKQFPVAGRPSKR